MSKLADRKFYFAKQPSEEPTVGIDFANDLDSGETISSFTVTAIDLADNSDVTAAITDQTTKAIDGSKVSARLRAGSDGSRYKITYQITTSASNKFEADIIMVVEEL